MFFWGKMKKIQELIAENRERIENLYRLMSEKHELIAEDRERIEDLYRLMSEKHALIAEDRKRIEDILRNISEEHKLAEHYGYQLEMCYALLSEKHEMIISDRKELYLPIKYSILEYWKEKDKNEEEAAVINYLKTHPLKMIPYEWADDYINRDVVVECDDGWKFVKHNENKLYFPKNFSMEEVSAYYNGLIMEQDTRSPHCYFSDTFDLNNDKYDIWIDCGAAEGLITLEHMKNFEKIVLIECDKNWIEALKKTFAPYADRVEIIEKAIDDTDSDSTITLNSLIKSKSKCVIKMDIEGFEERALTGLDVNEKLLKGSKMAICAYHRQEDYDNLTAYMRKRDISYETSDGFILSNWGGYSEPFLRKGVIRATI